MEKFHVSNDPNTPCDFPCLCKTSILSANRMLEGKSDKIIFSLGIKEKKK